MRPLRRAAMAGHADPQCAADFVGHRLGIAHRGRLDEGHTAGIKRPGCRGQFERQARLSATARAGQGEQPVARPSALTALPNSSQCDTRHMTTWSHGQRGGSS
jgi:hypothetical protein